MRPDAGGYDIGSSFPLARRPKPFRVIIEHKNPICEFARIRRHEFAFAAISERPDGQRFAVTRVEPPGLHLSASNLVHADFEPAADWSIDHREASGRIPCAAEPITPGSGN